METGAVSLLLILFALRAVAHVAASSTRHEPQIFARKLLIKNQCRVLENFRTCDAPNLTRPVLV